jgi:hypothetical protein
MRTFRNALVALALLGGYLLGLPQVLGAPTVTRSLSTPLTCSATQPLYFTKSDGVHATYNGKAYVMRGFTFYPQDIGAHTAWTSPSFIDYINQRVYPDSAALGQNVLRPLYQIDGQSGVSWDNPTLWANMDYLICNAAKHGNHVILDFTFMKDILAVQNLDPLNPVNWYPMIDALAPHYRNATAIAFVNFYSEPPHARTAADVAKLTTFYTGVMNRWWSIDQNHLLDPGGLGQLEDGYAGWWQAVYSVPHTSFIGFEAYSMLDLNYQPTVNAFAKAHHLLLFLNEFGAPQFMGDGVYSGQQWDGITMSRADFFHLVLHDSVVFQYAVSIFWNSGCQVGSGDFDVNAHTPAAQAMIRSYPARPPVGSEFC